MYLMLVIFLGVSVAHASAGTERLYSYKLQGKNFRTGKKCTTGKREFDSAKAMCLGLQNATLNKNCAIGERGVQFDKDCSRLGFSFLESKRCKLSVIHTSRKTVLASEEYCVGRRVNQEDISRLEIYKQIVPGIFAAGYMSFVPQQEEDSKRISSIEVGFAGSSGDSLVVLVPAEKIRMNKGFTGTMHSQSFGDMELQVSCRNDWGCE